MELDDLVRINKAWQYEELKVSDLEANVKLAQKAEHQTYMLEVPSSILYESNISVLGFILFLRSKASDANIANFV